ncbi:hypothetical protein N9421_00510 [bacterium]|nr:hypothetical protein [bacterium]
MNTIKKFKTKIFFKVFFITLFVSSRTFSLSPDYQNDLKNGCYMNSKQYLGSDRAKEYCLCTVEMLNKKFNDIQIDDLFKKNSDEIIKKTEFASIHCEKNKKAF